MLGPRVGDNMTDSSDNHISPPHMDLIWEPGLFRRLDFGEQGTRLCLNMFAPMTYEREMIFDLGDDFKHLYDSVYFMNTFSPPGCCFIQLLP